MGDKMKVVPIIVCIVMLISIPIIFIVSYSNKKENKKEDEIGVFVEIESHLSYEIVYDKDTRVIYAKSNSGTNTFCPLYNADGTLKLYKENNDE